MTIKNSKVRNGTLTLGTAPGHAFECQAKNVTLTPDFDTDGDPVETLCGDKLTPATTTSWTPAVTGTGTFEKRAMIAARPCGPFA